MRCQASMVQSVKKWVYNYEEKMKILDLSVDSHNLACTLSEKEASRSWLTSLKHTQSVEVWTNSAVVREDLGTQALGCTGQEQL